VNPQQKVELAATFSARPTLTTHPTMVPCSTFPKLLKAIMSSAAEAKLGALYINAREAIPMCVFLASGSEVGSCKA
jgi:hypothetical protein